jgi:hypothetical protein
MAISQSRRGLSHRARSMADSPQGVIARAGWRCSTVAVGRSPAFPQSVAERARVSSPLVSEPGRSSGCRQTDLTSLARRGIDASTRLIKEPAFAAPPLLVASLAERWLMAGILTDLGRGRREERSVGLNVASSSGGLTSLRPARGIFVLIGSADVSVGS